ncbi:MAG: glycosyltransferase family 2 protein [Pseudomonadota bacterium]
MTTPLLTICVANFQGQEVITRCLESVFDQRCDFSYEVLVHDDASTDESRKIVTRGFPAARLIIADDNLGFCISNNRMAKAARGEFLLLLNNDTRLHPGSLQTLVDAARADLQSGIWSLPQYSMHSGELLDRGMDIDLFANPIPVKLPRPEVAMVMGSCLLLRRSLWDELGGFPEWFGSIAEDMYLCHRVRLRGLKIRVTNSGGYDHEVGHSFGGGKVLGNRLASSYRRRQLSELNKSRVIVTCFPGALPWMILLFHFPLLLLEGIVMSVSERSLKPLRTVYLPSLCGILRDVPRLRRERLRCMQRRCISLLEFLQPIRLTHHKLTMLLRHGLPSLS